jgi:hypothetical protein
MKRAGAPLAVKVEEPRRLRKRQLQSGHLLIFRVNAHVHVVIGSACHHLLCR